MLISRRYDENHSLIMNFYNNGVDGNGNTKEGYEYAEECEREISPLAEAGDALETYLQGNSDANWAVVCLSAIDAKIAEIRNRKLAVH